MPPKTDNFHCFLLFYIAYMIDKAIAPIETITGNYLDKLQSSQGLAKETIFK